MENNLYTIRVLLNAIQEEVNKINSNTTYTPIDMKENERNFQQEIRKDMWTMFETVRKFRNA